MSPKQIAHYRALWGDARKVLRSRGMSPSDCESQRHAIHREVNKGKDISSLALTNPQFDAVKAAFWAIRYPEDVQTQIQQAEGGKTRRWHVLGGLCAELGEDDGYLAGIVARMQREGKLRPGGRDLQLDDLTNGEIDKLIIALRLQVRRKVEGEEMAENARRSAALKQEVLFA